MPLGHISFRALELESARMDERRRKKAWVKKGNPYLFIKAVEIVHLLTCPLKSLIPQEPRLMARLGYPRPYWWESRNKGTRSLLRQDVPRKPPRNMWSSWLWKNGSNNDRAMAWCHAMISCQKIRFVEYCSLYSGMWNLFCRAGHDSRVQNLLWSAQRRNPPCNAETICASDSSSLKPGLGATKGVLD